jgi:hypothetical protein
MASIGACFHAEQIALVAVAILAAIYGSFNGIGINQGLCSGYAGKGEILDGYCRKIRRCISG